MAARRPLYYDAGHLREMTDSDITRIQKKCVYLYGTDPATQLSIDSSAGGGLLNSMVDTRKTAGAQSTSEGDGDLVSGDQGDFIQETSTAEPGEATTTYNQLKQSISGISTDTYNANVVDTNNKRFPVYYNGADIQSMTSTDMFDTFISPAIDLLVADSDMDGTFKIHTQATLADHTLVSNKPVFTDTRANTSLYTPGGIPEVQDQPFDVATFYLFKTNPGTAFGDPDVKLPFLIDADNNLKRTNDSDFSQTLQQNMKYYTSTISGSTVRYQIGGSGVTKGTVMTDTKLDGAGDYRQNTTGSVGTQIYRSQEFPDGTDQVETSYSLKIRRE